MATITRALTEFEVKVYRAVKRDGNVETEALDEPITVFDVSMNKQKASAAFREAYGYERMPGGCVIDWKPVKTIKYAMDADKFIANATVIGEEIF